jgi:DNA-binding NtrC family response regulator
VSGKHLTGLTGGELAVDVGSTQVVDCDEGAAALLGVDPASLVGKPLSLALKARAGFDTTLAQVVQSPCPLLLPPFLAAGPNGREIVLEAVLHPHVEVSRLSLWPVLEDDRLDVPGDLKPSDTLACLGVDGFSYDADWGIADTVKLTAEIHRSLLDIARKSDSVSEPSLASLSLVIRDSGLDGARDICLALLSHLHGDSRLRLAQRGMRISIGLARHEVGSSLATWLAASHALLQARARGESIRHAREGDYAQLVGRALTGASVLQCPRFGASSTVSGSVSKETAAAPPGAKRPPPVAPIEKGIEGYVVDNMEGAVDQAVFLAGLDLPVAVIGPAGTGKMYIARVIHEESGGAEDMLVAIDCREFRSRSAAQSRIASELASGEGKTLVFKSPHLMHQEVQQKLARQISSRRLADVSPPRYLPKAKLIALFPEPLEVLIRRGELVESLASAFAGYPIRVPPIRDRKQAVLRWAHKILGQEGILRDRDMKGFTPDAEQAMLLYDWPGNISEMRQCIHNALDKTDKDWLTPVDLGLFKGISAEGVPQQPATRPFLAAPAEAEALEESYTPTTLEAVHVALGEAVHNLLALDMIKPLGLWIEDELVLAALDRYRGDAPRAAGFLHTRPRNISRWMPKITAREADRNSSSLWQEPRRLLREWVRESPTLEESPLTLMGDKLMAHLSARGGELSSATRARILGVSTPTYLKRLREQEDRRREH